MARLSSVEILESSVLCEKEIEIPQWGGSVIIKEFSKAKQQQIRREATDIENGEINTDKLELLMFIHGVIDPVLSQEDYFALREKSAMAIDIVLKEIMDLSGLNQAVIKEKEKQFRT